MKFFDRNSIKTQILLIVASSTVIAVGCAFATIVINYFVSARKTRVNQVSAVAEILASNSSVALSFGESETTTELLRSLEKQPQIHSVTIVDFEHQSFAEYGPQDYLVEQMDASRQDHAWHRYDGDMLIVHRPIKEFDETIGGLYVAADTSDLWANGRAFMRDTLYIIVPVMIFVLTVSYFFQRSISNPILRLTRAVQNISRNNDYSIRFGEQVPGEVGVLGQQFDFMLDQMESKNHELTAMSSQLKQSNLDLEQRVEDRTQELKEAYEQLVDENEKRQRAYQELEETQSQLVESSRAAGMADIATGVLHNIGNVLNSINVASQSATDEITELRFDMLERTVGLLNEKKHELGDRWIEYPKFQNLPVMLETLSGNFRSCQKNAVDELEALRENVEFVKDIVKSQQEVALKGNMVTTTRGSRLFEYALKLLSSKISSDVTIVKRYDADGEFQVDKNKVLQILTNFIKNALEAISSFEGSTRQIELITEESKPGWIALKVRDSGCGISRKNLEKMFSFGFTTKKSGHGFGLHSAACAAKEMNGRVTVESDGEGFGACFGIEVPMSLESVTETRARHETLV